MQGPGTAHDNYVDRIRSKMRRWACGWHVWEGRWSGCVGCLRVGLLCCVYTPPAYWQEVMLDMWGAESFKGEGIHMD